jgi:hypothetical protein
MIVRKTFVGHGCQGVVCQRVVRGHQRAAQGVKTGCHAGLAPQNLDNMQRRLYGPSDRRNAWVINNRMALLSVEFFIA